MPEVFLTISMFKRSFGILHTLNSTYNEVAFNEKLVITKGNLQAKYTHSPINMSPLNKSCP